MLAYVTLFGQIANLADQSTELCDREPIMLVRNNKERGNTIISRNEVKLICRDTNPGICYIAVYTERFGGEPIALMQLVDAPVHDSTVLITDGALEFGIGGDNAKRVLSEN